MENPYTYEGWRGFAEGSWVHEIDLRSFIRHNFTMYDGDESFLEGPAAFWIWTPAPSPPSPPTAPVT